MRTRKTDRKLRSPLVSNGEDATLPEVLVVEEHDPFEHGVLVVDDCELMRLMLRLALERAGFRVLLATRGTEAIRLYRQHRSTIAAVLLDVQMPEMDGPHTLAELMNLDPHIRACFVSGDTGDYTPEDLIRQGARAVFYKPFRIADLGEAVRRIVDGKGPDRIADRPPELRSSAMFAEDIMIASAGTTENWSPE